METKKVSEIVCREDLYPRIEKNPLTVQKYAECLDVLPPIEINQHNELIDGWHKQPRHHMSWSQKTILNLIAKMFKHCVECEFAHDLNLDPRTGVYTIRGSIKGSNTEKIGFDGPQTIEKLLTNEKKEIKTYEELNKFLNPLL